MCLRVYAGAKRDGPEYLLEGCVHNLPRSFKFDGLVLVQGRFYFFIESIAEGIPFLLGLYCLGLTGTHNLDPFFVRFIRRNGRLGPSNSS